MKKIFTLLALLSVLIVRGQTATDNKPKSLSFSGYMEAYYLYDFGNENNHVRPFSTCYNRTNEFNINILFAKATYTRTNMRANLALGWGSYMDANYANEPATLKNIINANIGIKLSKKENFWLDAGVFDSHIGMETIVGKDNWLLTRSVPSEQVPFYETGVKLSYTTLNKNWLFAALLLNGWQDIQRIDGNQTPALGHQITYTNKKLIINSSSFIGNVLPDSIKALRFFHNLYAQIELLRNINIALGIDVGMQQKAPNSNRYNVWYAPLLVARIQLNSTSMIAGRVEYYHDANGVMIPTKTSNGFQTFGYSINYDHAITHNVLWRVEARELIGRNKIFTQNRQPTNTEVFVTTALSITL